MSLISYRWARTLIPSSSTGAAMDIIHDDCIWWRVCLIPDKILSMASLSAPTRIMKIAWPSSLSGLSLFASHLMWAASDFGPIFITPHWIFDLATKVPHADYFLSSRGTMFVRSPTHGICGPTIDIFCCHWIPKHETAIIR